MATRKVLVIGGDGRLQQRQAGDVLDLVVADVPAFTVVSLTDGSTVTWATAGLAFPNATVTLGGDRTLSVTGAVSGQRGKLIVKQDATGGRTLAMPAGSLFPGGSYSLSSAANAIDLLTYLYDGTNFLWVLDKAFASPPPVSPP